MLCVQSSQKKGIQLLTQAYRFKYYMRRIAVRLHVRREGVVAKQFKGDLLNYSHPGERAKCGKTQNCMHAESTFYIRFPVHHSAMLLLISKINTMYMVKKEENSKLTMGLGEEEG
ncbi:hypothetical protein POVCU1_003840 [Plasmodium ovale curtisi]|uniref:Uncharacterized protein n=1 Tax=Plasmodium ovale curtisi TaxID=864141 RepID=A0A1A8VK77_PLAOA|nr:hypothetical protein POVCU1_003840 [Plasmodium ovale curtisi]